MTLSSYSEDDILKELEELSLEAQERKGKVSSTIKTTQFNHRFYSVDIKGEACVKIQFFSPESGHHRTHAEH